MKVMVCIKQVIDYGINNNKDGEKFIINPFCEYALEQALQLKDIGCASEIIAVSVCNENQTDHLKKALALGVDRAVLVAVDKTVKTDPITTAQILYGICRQEKAELIVSGEQSIDDNHNQVGQLLAALCGWGQATAVLDLKVDDKTAAVTRLTDKGTEQRLLKLPVVVTVSIGMQKPRYVTLKGLMAAKKKTIEIIPHQKLSVSTTNKLKTISIRERQKTKECIIIDTIDDFLNVLEKKGETA